MDRNCQFSVTYSALSSASCSCVGRHREFFLISYNLWKDLLLSLETVCCDGHQTQLLFLPSPLAVVKVLVSSLLKYRTNANSSPRSSERNYSPGSQDSLPGCRAMTLGGIVSHVGHSGRGHI